MDRNVLEQRFMNELTFLDGMSVGAVVMGTILTYAYAEMMGSRAPLLDTVRWFGPPLTMVFMLLVGRLSPDGGEINRLSTLIFWGAFIWQIVVISRSRRGSRVS